MRAEIGTLLGVREQTPSGALGCWHFSKLMAPSSKQGLASGDHDAQGKYPTACCHLLSPSQPGKAMLDGFPHSCPGQGGPHASQIQHLALSWDDLPAELEDELRGVHLLQDCWGLRYRTDLIKNEDSPLKGMHFQRSPCQHLLSWLLTPNTPHLQCYPPTHPPAP